MIALALHGILTGRSDVTWPERLQTFAHRVAPGGFVVLTDQYDAGPFPKINWWIGNPRMAAAMTRRVLSWVDDGVHERVALIGHSNGCDIVRRVAIELAEMGVQVDALIMVAPPISPDLKKNGLGELLTTGKLKRAVCYFTPGDHVLAPPRTLNPLTWLGGAARWPYGNAGRVGFTGCPTVLGHAPAPNAAAFNRIFPDYGHTTYFSPEASPSTFNTILTDARTA